MITLALIRITHFFIVIFILFGWMLPCSYLKWYLLLIAMLFIQNILIGSKCILTIWEYKLRGQPFGASFNQRLLHTFLNIDWPERRVRVLEYVLVICLTALVLWRIKKCSYHPRLP